MLNDHQKAQQEFLKKLHEQQRKQILETRNANWRETSPIVDAILRAEKEDQEANPEAATSPEGQQWAIDVSLMGMQDSMLINVPTFETMTKKPEAMKPPPAFRPEIKRPEMEVSLSTPKAENAEGDNDIPQFVPDDDTVSPPQFFDSIQDREQPEQPPPFVTPPGLVGRPEKKESKRQAMLSRRNRAMGFPDPPQPPKEQEQADEPEEKPQQEAPRSFPFLMGNTTFRLGNEHPQTRETDGGFEPDDVAQALSLASDEAEITLAMVIESLERITHAMVKMQGDLNVVNEMLDRSFGH